MMSETEQHLCKVSTRQEASRVIFESNACTYKNSFVTHIDLITDMLHT